MLHFPPESFFHLAGLQHLSDITFPSTNKERIYKEIINRKLLIDDIRKSVFYEKWGIDDRLSIFQYLEDMICSDSITYMINTNQYMTYTKIKADYLFERKISNGILYLFLIIEKHYPRFENECKGCSFFKKNNYKYGTIKTAILLIDKIESGNKIPIYRNPIYVENK